MPPEALALAWRARSISNQDQGRPLAFDIFAHHAENERFRLPAVSTAGCNRDVEKRG